MWVIKTITVFSVYWIYMFNIVKPKVEMNQIPGIITQPLRYIFKTFEVPAQFSNPPLGKGSVNVHFFQKGLFDKRIIPDGNGIS